MDNYGPSVEAYKISRALNLYIQACTSYVTGLSPFYQYCVWRYTIGSAAINSKLITGRDSPNAPFWVFLFCQYFNNTYPDGVQLPKSFLKYKNYLYNPSLYAALTKSDKIAISSQFIDDYISILQNIILQSPTVEEGFEVYKVASVYPQLPKPGDPLPVDVLQLPFNSTTVNPHFNFAIFTPTPGNNYCLFKIKIETGAKCLYVPSNLHAYPWEHEIILPINTIFRVNKINIGDLSFIDPIDMNIQMVQDKEDIVVGPVFVVNDYRPTKSGDAFIRSKQILTYHVTI